MNSSLYVGLMSGTSMDAIDSALVKCEGDSVELQYTHQHAISESTRLRIAAISQPGENEIERMGELDRELGRLFAAATSALLNKAATAPQQVCAIGSHGQTIRHRPPSGAGDYRENFTLQIGDPNTIAELTQITTVADFRRRDIATGGEGAPLAPAFHGAAFAKPGVNRAVVNIGGIANVSLLEGTTLLQGFDTGPGNTLLDHWIGRTQGALYDRDGAWAAEGLVLQPLLKHLLQHPYFALTGPRSTGKEAFNLDWLDRCSAGLAGASEQDIQATLAELTAITIAQGIRSSGLDVTEVYICGGGAHNTDLMRRIYRQIAPASLDTTQALGMDPDWVEAVTFAWLASQTMAHRPGNAPAVTGARHARILGGIFQA